MLLAGLGAACSALGLFKSLWIMLGMILAEELLGCWANTALPQYKAGWQPRC